MNRKLMIVIPVVAVVVALSTGFSVAYAKGANPGANYSTISGYTTPAATNPDNSSPQAHCGNYGGMMGWMNGQGVVTQQVADLLGTTTADLQSQLSSGKTLAEIASAKGIGNDQLVQTLLAPFKDHMDLMLKDGYLTQDQVNTMTQQMQERLQAVIIGKVSADNGADFMNEMMREYGGNMMQGNYNGMMQGNSGNIQRNGGGMMGGFRGGMMGR